MNETYYIIQMRSWHWTGKWLDIGYRFNTLEEARAALAKRGNPPDYRIAEAYTVVRFRPVK